MTRTAQQLREQAKDRYNASLMECPGHQVLSILSDKWATLVVSALSEGSLRHSELHREVAGATPKMLTQTLRRLERDGLVSRHVTADVPVRVDYELTELGRDLVPLQRAIRDWASSRIDAIHAARERFDAGLSG